MSLDVAPYNTAMRIGQGFNTYTHEICVNDAVVVDDAKPGGDHYSADNSKVSQMVTYCTRYVDKLSQVTDAMSISAALSIKSAAAGGGASGSYVDSDKFKESDINFFVQVKVTNQVIMAEDVTKYQPIPGVTGGPEFAKVFGDSFISGFIEGGELDAIISIKVKDEGKANNIKAALEANFGKGGVGGSLQGDAAITHAKAFSDTETTITVNWCGGGNIKQKSTLWSIETLTQAAAEFPQNVADCPQRIYAILTKYTALRSFQTQEPRITPLMYENASLYTNDLLDAYMDYRNIWKQIHVDSVAFEFGQVTLSKSDDHKPRSSIKPQQEDRMLLIEDIISYVEGASDKTHQEHVKDVIAKMAKPNYREHDSLAYEPSITGLEKARKDCRVEMLKIVNEVDAVTKDPDIALNPDRDCGYLNPALFRKLLPKSSPKSANPKPLVNGNSVVAAVPEDKFYASIKPLPQDVEDWVKSLKPEQTAGFQMTTYAGDHTSHNPGKFDNSFREVTKASRVASIEVWVVNNHIASLRVNYQGNHPAPQTLGKPIPTAANQKWDVPENQRITSMMIYAADSDFAAKVVYGFRFSTDQLESHYLGHPENGERKIEPLKLQAPEVEWSLKGFWAQSGDGLDRVGVFWGQDEEPKINGVK